MIDYILTEKVYHGYKASLEQYYQKYFTKDGHLLLWRNTPICRFAIDYVHYGDKILSEKILSNHIFVKYEYDRYSSSESVKNDTHKYKAAERLIRIIKSIRKFGYAEHKFNDKRHLIRVERGFSSPYGSDPNGYRLVARKHKLSACYALGLKEIKAQIHEAK